MSNTLERFDWTRDPNGGGFTGIVANRWKAYVLNNGTWTLYQWGQLKHFATGRKPSVASARLAVAAATKQETAP